MKTTLRALALGLASVIATACSSSEESENPPVHRPDGGAADGGATDGGGEDGGGEGPQALSQAFASSCAHCHGAEGQGTGGAPRLPGVSDVESYVTTVREGRRGMPSFSATTISDEDLRADYEWLTTQR